MPDRPPSVDVIFMEAADIPDGSQRSVYLDRVCGDDNELRERVERLLAAVPRIGSFLEAPAYQPTNPAAAIEPMVIVDLIGQMIGPYTLLQKLGEGGMGAVYLAQQEQPVRRQVAIKVIRAGMDSAQVAACFEQERVALALMDHPHIARLLDAGITSDARPYFAMELVKGMPITTYCDQQKLTLKERLKLFIPVCRAVQHAHQKGIIHRDLKPSNVIVGLYDGRPIPKVIDFGVAKATGQRLIERTLFTELGQVVGTIEYMAPEQTEVNNLDVDTRADIYSLGVMLYELLTGSTPFTIQQLRLAGLSEMWRIIQESDPARPSTRVSTAADLPRVAENRQLEPRRLATAIKGELDWIALKCLEKDRARRYETANGLAADLERYLADEPVLACPPSTGYRLRKIVQRHWRWIAAATAFVSLLLCGIVGQSVTLIAVNRERQAKVAAFEAEANRRRQTQAALDAMSSRVIEDWLTKQPVLLPEHKEFLQMALAFYEDFAADTGQDEESRSAVANAQRRVGTIRAQLGQYADAAVAFRRSQNLYVGLAAENLRNRTYRRELAAASVSLGGSLGKLGQFTAAESALRQGVDTYRELTASFPAEVEFRVGYGQALIRFGILLRNRGRLDGAEDAYHQAITILQQLVDQFTTELAYQDLLAGAYLNLGNLLSTIPDRSSDAVDALRKTVAIYEQLTTKAPTNSHYRDQFAISSNSLGLILTGDDQLVAAEKAIHQALDIKRQLAAEFPSVPEYRRGVAISLNNLGIVLKNTQRLDEAEVVYREALTIHEQLMRDYPGIPDHQNEVAGAMTNLARLLQLSHRELDTARRLLEEALPHHQAALQASPGHPVYRNFYRLNRWRLAEILLELKEHAAAAEVAVQFLQVAFEMPRDAYIAAGLLAGCARLAAEDEQMTPSERQVRATAYKASALAALRQALDNGFTDVDLLRHDPTFELLRSREEFQSLINEIDPLDN